MTTTYPQVLGPANAQWNDFVGTAAADDLELTDQYRSLYQFAGLNPARWLITGVDFALRDSAQRVLVYAFDREASGVTTPSDLLDVADDRGELPVVGFELDVPADDALWLSLLFRHVVVRLVARSVRDVPMVVTGIEGRDARA